MSTDDSVTKYDIQAESDSDVSETVENILAAKRQRRRKQSDLETEAQVKQLLKTAQDALAIDKELASMVLEELHKILRHDADLDEVLRPDSDRLVEEAHLTEDEAARVRATWRRHKRLRKSGNRRPDADREYVNLSNIAKALGYYTDLEDLTEYAPVRMEAIDEPGHTSPAPADIRPVGRRRLAKDSIQTKKDATVEIPHESCDHILAVALPRRGKDSTIASIGKNLYEQHGYSYFSIYDDGRMETPMTAVPAQEDVIHENLGMLGQEPEPFDAEVLVPAVNLPNQLPANFRPFTFSIADLTPWSILRLGGVNSRKSTTESRIQQALNETLERSGTVEDLVNRLHAKAGELSSPIKWTEKVQNGEEVHETRCEMRADNAVQKAANAIARLAGEGLIAGRDAETNLDMAEAIKDQETASVLCCNFLPAGKESLRFTIIDIFLQMLYQTIDENARLPRVCLEMRELKKLAPSKSADVRYKDAVKGLKQTLFFLATQGGSRRILLLGSTQKLNDVYKPVRTNFATKILLELGEEEIDTLDKSYHFGDEVKRQLKTFVKGMGMVISSEGMYWPIRWRGAPCGLGDGDRHWLDQYAQAYGARVREIETNHYWQGSHSDSDWWVHVTDGEVHEMSDPPEIGDFYSQWYLLEEDFPDGIEPEYVDAELIEHALDQRREYDLRTDIGIAPVGASNLQREVQMTPRAETKAEAQQQTAQRFDIPQRIGPWLDKAPQKRERFISILEAVAEADEQLTSLNDVTDLGHEVPRETLGKYYAADDELDPCLAKPDSGYRLTEVGEEALEVSWPSAVEHYEEIL